MLYSYAHLDGFTSRRSDVILEPLRSESNLLGLFFQAEDGIRDWSVTGVQTCALPISITSRIPTEISITACPGATMAAWLDINPRTNFHAAGEWLFLM